MTTLAIKIMAFVIVGGLGIFSGDGEIFGRRAQETREPIIVVDTVSVVAGYGSLQLSETFNMKKRNVSPSSKNSLFATVTPILTDSTGTVYYYGYSFKANENRVIVKSSGGAADTGKVAIQIILR